ncbi:patatin-like phospholipase family protein [Agrobacterium vitis]|uniref:hypothetical protein n=1 Tax=Allorhizobium ampelinum TaxID=3025782 RepID=UPI001F1998B7|nr:hypothetical protein [Allorhizobium ampelinum]MCF1450715.1 hypothetical protein [Allorhizobium ampelinum]
MSTPFVENDNELIQREAELIWGKETLKPDKVLGVAASGGGIRSATVALGALQALAQAGLLEKFSYLSTVSGGGYLGSALSWFWSGGPFIGKKVERDKAAFGCEPGNFPFQVRPADQEKPSCGYKQLSVTEKAYKNLDFLRHHGSYLTSADHIGFVALVLSVIRTVVISLIVWIPLLIFLFCLIEFGELRANLLRDICATEEPPLYCAPIMELLPRPFYSTLLYAGLLTFVVFVVMAITLSLVKPGIKDDKIDVLAGALYLLLAAGIVCSIVMLFYFSATTGPITSALAMLSSLFAGPAIAVGLAKFTRMNASYMLRRFFDKSSGIVVTSGLLAFFMGLMPTITGIPDPSVRSLPASGSIWSTYLGTVSLLSGVGTAIYGYYIKARSILPSTSGKITSIIGSILFIYGLFLFCFISAHLVMHLHDDRLINATLLFLLVTGLYLGCRSSLNSNGLHRFYRDRLMETFLPDAGAILRGNAMQSDAADTFSLAEMWKHDANDQKRPYHIVNAHAILTNSADAKVALRGGDNFIMSAGFVGSQATGWMRTDKYIEENGPLTLASAMAASGAAANANAGYIGTGVTRERWLSVVMSLLNIRLGLWITNPNARAKRKAGKTWYSSPTYFGPTLLSGILNLGYHEKARFLELSDGGHFENLGIYELIRRKVSVIVAIDGEQDGSLNLPSLVSSINRVREDFGAVVTFSNTHGPSLLLPRESREYPDGVKISQFPFIVADIRYRGGSRGVLIYIKATMTSELDFCTRGYRAANPDFPHQTTADQFFDPEQFEAYRDLGMKSCRQAIELLGLKDSFDLDDILGNYHSLATED